MADVIASSGPALVFVGENAKVARLALHTLAEIAQNLHDGPDGEVFHVLIDGVDTELRRAELIEYKDWYDREVKPQVADVPEFA